MAPAPVFNPFEGLPEFARFISEGPSPETFVGQVQCCLFPFLSVLGYAVFDTAEVQAGADPWLRIADTYVLGYALKGEKLERCPESLAISLEKEGLVIWLRDKTGTWSQGLKKSWKDLGEGDPLILALSKKGLDAPALEELASGSRMISQLVDFLEQQFEHPSRGFLNFLSTAVLKSPLNKETEAALGTHVTAALEQFALNHHPESPVSLEGQLLDVITSLLVEELPERRKLAVRVGKTYTSVLLDDNNRRPLCRLYELDKGFSLGIMEGTREVKRVPLARIRDLEQHRGCLIRQLKHFLGELEEINVPGESES